MVAGERGKFQTGKGRRATELWGDQGPQHQPWVPWSRWETRVWEGRPVAGEVLGSANSFGDLK